MLEMVNAGLAPITVVDDYLAEFWSQVLTDITVHRNVTLRSGRETVTYVSNVYEYYIAHRLIAAQQERRDAARAEVGKRKESDRPRRS